MAELPDDVPMIPCIHCGGTGRVPKPTALGATQTLRYCCLNCGRSLAYYATTCPGCGETDAVRAR